jgi:CheY-like chemotaxis protein
LDAAKSKLPNLILLDLRRPDSDGVDAVIGLKTNRVTADIPVAILAMPGSRADQEACPMRNPPVAGHFSRTVTIGG